MSDGQKIKSPLYGTLLINEKDSALINFFIQVVQAPENIESFKQFIAFYHISKEDFMSFVERYSDLEHEMDWCKDPFCKYPKKKKNETDN